MSYILEYREPGVRPGTTRLARRRVENVREAVAWMNAHRESAFTPAAVITGSWRRPTVVAILGYVAYVPKPPSHPS